MSQPSQIDLTQLVFRIGRAGLGYPLLKLGCAAGRRVIALLAKSGGEGEETQR